MFNIRYIRSVPGALIKFFLAYILVFSCLLLYSQSSKEAQLKVILISRFFEFVKWPDTDSENMNQIHIGIIGDSFLLKYRDMLSQHIKVPGKQIKIKYINKLSQINDCHALFISHDESYRLEDILAVTADKPILSIGDSWGFGEKGVLINLYKIGTKIKFEINQAAVKRSGLSFSSKLYKLARVIK